MRNPIEAWRSSRSPFRDVQSEMQRLQSRMDSLFSELVPWSSQSMASEASLIPRAEVSEDNANYYFKFDIPGVSKEHIKVELVDKSLTVSAERKEEKKKETQRSFVSEVSYGSYMRSFELPAAVDEKKIDAHFENGVLSLKVPKTEATPAKQITIQ